MRGRYEKPKQKRFGKSPNAGNSYPNSPAGSAGDMGDYASGAGDNSYNYNYSYNSQNGYSAGSYGQGGYNQNNGYNQNGYYPQAGYPGSGYGQGGSTPPQKPQKGGFGWALLGFFIPLAGLILFLCWKKKQPGKARSAGRGALIGFITSIVLTVLLAILGAVGLDSYLNSMFDQVNQVEVTVSYTEETEAPTETVEVTEVVTTEPPHVASREDYINILVAGQSSRGPEDKEQARFADSMMLVTINTHEKKMIITSLLRDTLVHPPDYKGKTFGNIKLTTVYHLGYVYAGNQIAGSMELMDMTLYKNFGIEVDYNFEIDFKMFETIINRLGGVTIIMDEAEAKYLTKEMESMMPGVYSEAYGGDFEAGYPYELDGFSSLAFARMRHAEGDGDSDIKRTSRQQRFVKAVLDKVKTMSLSELQSIANDVLPMVSTSMTSKQMSDLMKQLLPMLPEMSLESGGTCPANYRGEMLDIYKDGFMHSVLKFNVDETKEYMRELTLGEKPKSGKSRLTHATIPDAPPETTRPGSPAAKPAETKAPATVPTEAPAETKAPEKPSETQKPTEFVPPIQATQPPKETKPAK